MQIKDSLALDASGLSRSSDGYLVGTARVSRAGNVQQYLGREIGLTGDDANKVFGVYRDPDVVFDEDSMASLAGRPVTRNHPPEGVTADTWKELSVGSMGGRVVRDGEHVVASMAIMDSAAAAEVERGARSLSAGYSVNIVKDSGTAQDGTPYQFRQAGPLRFNHVAYLPDNNPRAGDTRIGDGFRSWGDAPIQDVQSGGNNPAAPMYDRKPQEAVMHLVTMDGTSIEVADKSTAQLIQAQFDSLQKRASDSEDQLAQAVSAKDAAEAKADTLDAKVKELEAKTSDEAISARVKEVGDAKAQAAKLAGKDFACDSCDPLAIQRAALGAADIKCGRYESWDAAPDAYVCAVFDMSYAEKEKEEEEDAKKSKAAKDSLSQFGKDFGDARPTEDAQAQRDQVRQDFLDARYGRKQAQEA